MGKIELEVEHRYELTAEQVGASLGESDWTNIFARWSFAMADGRMASIIDGRIVAGRARPTALALFGAGTVTIAPIRPPSGPRELWDYAAFAVSDQVMLLRGTRNLTAVSTVEPYSSTAWSVSNDVVQRDLISPDLALRPYEESQIVALGDLAAIPLGGIRRGQRLGFLKLDVSAREARWMSWPEDAPRTLPRNVVSIFRSGLTKKVPYEQLVYLPSVEHWNDRQHGLNEPIEDHAYAPINQAIAREGDVLAFTNGHDLVQYGRWCTSLSVIDRSGHVAKRLFHEQYDPDGLKKHGVSARFTSSGRYAVLAHFYRSTDEWSGRQKLLDLETGELIDLAPPQGMSRFRIIDHAGDRFWLTSVDDFSRQNPVSCRLR